MSSIAPSMALTDLSPLKLALLAERIRGESEAVLRASPIAIVGMACRLPGGVESPEDFWKLLSSGIDAIGEIPAGRWDANGLYDPDPSAPGRIASKWGGFLERVDEFDASFFGILRREAEQMDPQHRVFLEVAIDALNNAGLPRERLAGSRTGAFIASYYNEYAQLQYEDPDAVNARTLTGTLHSVLVNRLSYLLDLRGPSISIDTACSSSLVAIHLACQSLRYGECDTALAGGVSLLVSEGGMLSLSKVGFMAPDGRCKTFDASADGFGRGEGCSIVVLKRLADAMADGDRVLALIRGSAVNQDGHSTVLAAPNGLAQQDLIREALSNAQLEPARIGYVEAHGTGTPLGDPIEVEALAATVGRPTPAADTCYIGAAKANVGHLEAAAGSTGVIKSVLVLQKEEIPPQVHFRTLNPHINLSGTRLAIPAARTPWPRGTSPRCIGTSGFGVGGTNAHVVLEEAPQLDASRDAVYRPAPWLLPLSAQGPEALRALAERWVDFLNMSTVPCDALCASAGERRSHYDNRLAVVGGSAESLITQLRAFAAGSAPDSVFTGKRPAAGQRLLAFIFSGQGQQWVGMGQDLLRTEPVFRDALADVDARLRRHVTWSLLEELSAPTERSRLDETLVAQPAIFGIQIALSALWSHWGFVPDAVAGHSIGEISALHVAGVLSLDEAIRIVTLRAEHMQRATGQGAMATAALSESAARKRIAAYGNRLSIAAINAPSSVVFSGDADALAEVVAGLERDAVPQRALPVNYAFHSAQMQPHADALASAIGAVQCCESRIPVYSTVTGARLGDTVVDAAYFARNVREPVRFAAAIHAMLADGCSEFLEIAAHPVLAGALAECIGEERDDTTLVVGSLRRGKSERETMLLACAALYANGRNPDWVGLQGDVADVHDLPAYPWQRERYWLPPRANAAHKLRGAEPAHPLLGNRLATAGATTFEAEWPLDRAAWLTHHVVGDRVIMPGMAMLECLRLAACASLQVNAVSIDDFVVLRPLLIPADNATRRTWQTVAGEADGRSCSVTLYCNSDDTSGAWLKIATARATVAEASDTQIDIGAATGSTVDVDSLYESFSKLGINFGPSFRTVERLHVHETPGRATAWLHCTNHQAADGAWNALLLDGAIQSCVATLGNGRATRAVLPIGVDRCVVYGDLEARVRVELQVTESDAGVVSADIQIVGSAGELLAQLTGVRLAPAAEAAVPVAADPWLHEVVWEETPPPIGQRAADAAWLLLADEPTAQHGLLDALNANGQRAHCIPASLADWTKQINDTAWRGHRPLDGVIYLPSAAGTSDRLAHRLLHLVQNLTGRVEGPLPLVVVTTSAQPAAGTVPLAAQAALWGLGNTIATEHPELDLRLVDLDHESEASPTLLAAWLGSKSTGASRIVIRGGKLLRPRLRHRPSLSQTNVQLTFDAVTPGALNWTAASRSEPAADEVRIRVHAAGLNFRDVLMSLGMIPDQAQYLGAECAGIVEAVGSAVSELRVGDAVFGLAPGSLASTVIVPAHHVTRWPANLGTLAVAASLPAAYLTAMLGLQRIAELRAGQRVLIHAAAGGVGMAAVQVARMVGAEVFATAGSPEKRALLQQMGVQHVFHSRTVEFASQINAIVGDSGIDVVLNSLAGDFIEASVRTLAPNGCFLELGKRDVWSVERFRSLRPSARYHVYDLGTMAAADRQLVPSMMAELLGDLHARRLQPLPVRVFDMKEASEAFRYMAQARHVGKLVLHLPAADERTPLVHSDATYLVTGGLGALGLHTARWLADQGATHLVLISRRPPDAAALPQLNELQRRGVSVTTRQVDVADEELMRTVLADIAHSGPALRGIVHAAGVLDDGVLLQQTAERFRMVRRGKVEGALVLDTLTRDLPLDFFVLYSAAGLLLGPRGQGPYAAANAELDALAYQRRSAGLPALSVAWGLWRGEGMAVNNTASGTKSWSERGLDWIDAQPGFTRLERLLREGAVHAAVLPIDWNRFLSQMPEGIDAEFFAHLRRDRQSIARERESTTNTSMAVVWRALTESQRRPAVTTFVAGKALQVIGLPISMQLNPKQALKEVGLDSLMAVELRNVLARAVGTSLPATLLFDYPSLDAIAGFLMKRLQLEPAAASATPLTVSTTARNNGITQLSDEEAEAELLAELEGSASRPRS